MSLLRSFQNLQFTLWALAHGYKNVKPTALFFKYQSRINKQMPVVFDKVLIILNEMVKIISGYGHSFERSGQNYIGV